MRRRDFLATLAAAVGCAAVPALASSQPDRACKNPIQIRDKNWGPQYEWIQIDVGDPNLWYVIEKTRAAQPRR